MQSARPELSPFLKTGHGFVLLALMCLGFSTPALSQPKSTDDILVFQRHDVDHNSTIGIPIGAFMLDAGANYTSTYSDNVFLRQNNKKKDLINVTRPGIALQSNWGRHELFLGAQATKTDYRLYNQKDATDFGTILSGTYDITYGTYVDGYILKTQRNLNRGSEEDVDGSVPIKFNSMTSRIGFSRVLSYIQTKLSWLYDSTDREVDSATTPVAGDFLSRNKHTVEGSLIYEYLPNNSLFLSSTQSHISYDLYGGNSRMLNKTDIRYGLNFSYWGIYSGSIYGGHIMSDYVNMNTSSNDPYIGGSFNWMPSRLTTVSLNSGRSYSDGSISANEKIVVDTTKLGVSHQITRFVTGNVSGSIADNDYQTYTGFSTSKNRVYTFSADTKYQVSDNLGLKLSYEHKDRSSDVAGQDYKNNRVMFSVTYMH